MQYIKTNAGYTPLICAVTHGDTVLVKYLIAECKADISIVAASNKGVQHYVKNNPNHEVIEYVARYILFQGDHNE